MTDYAGIKPSISRKALYGFQSALGHMGAGEAYRKATGMHSGVILMYHSVPDPQQATWIDPRQAFPQSVFERQMKYLARNRKVVSLAELARLLRERAQLPEGFVAITFDDGYADNLTFAFPLLKKLGLPATLFVATAQIESRSPQWVDRLYSAFRYRRVHELRLELGDWSARFDLTTSSRASECYRDICRKLVSADLKTRETCIDSVRKQLRPTRQPPCLTLGWDELMRVREEYPHIEIGSHTVNHLDLTSQPDPVIHEELVVSRQLLANRLGEPVRFLAYPYNRTVRAAQERVSAAGYQAAVGAPGVASVQEDSLLYALPRLEAPPTMGRLKFVTSGAFPELSMRLTGRC